MKRTTLILAILLSSVFALHAQHHRLFVSLKDGSRSVWLMGKRGYNAYFFSNASPVCDTLICRGKGLERSRIDKDVIRHSGESGLDYEILNKAIRRAYRRIRHSPYEQDLFTMEIDGRTVWIRWERTGKKKDVDMQLELIRP